MSDASALRDLAKKLISDPSGLENMDREEAIKLSRALNPMNNVVSLNESFANLSIRNWREEYMKKYLMTGLIGYLHRVAKEYEAEPFVKAAAEKAKASGADVKTAEERAKKTVDAIVADFLRRNFEFNPDRHLLAAHTDNPDDPERPAKETLIKKRVDNGPLVDKLQGRISESPEKVYGFLRESLLQANQLIARSYDASLQLMKVFTDDSLDLEDKMTIMSKIIVDLRKLKEEIGKVAVPLEMADTLSTLTVDPPVNVFHHWTRYMDNHFETLRDVVTAVYNEKPDIEFSIQFYEAFKDEESAKKHRMQREAEFSTTVTTISNQGIVLLGPFKQNRERVDFYNKNVEPIKRMAEQQARDHKLGKDLMEKRVRDEKKKNVMEAGPDAPELAKYSRAVGIIAELGEKKGLTQEEQDKLREAIREKESAEVPDEAVQVDIFYPAETEDGNVSLKRTKMYTQEEAPLHLQENSEFADSYQPKRPEGVSIDDSLQTKTVVGRDGQKRQISSLRAELQTMKK